MVRDHPSPEARGDPHSQLMLQAQDFLSSALDHLKAERFHRFFADAGAALELLGKATLSKLSPALIVGDDFDSLVAVLRLPVARKHSVGVRTINSKKLLERLVRVIPQLAPDQPYLREIFELRNSTLHYFHHTDDHFANLVASLHRYAAQCAQYLRVSLETIIPRENHRALLQHFDQQDSSVWSALAANRISEAKTASIRAASGESQSEKADANDLLSPPPGQPPASIAVRVKCPACEQLTEVTYTKELTDLLNSNEDGDTFRVQYGLNSFGCTKCPLVLPNPKYFAAAGIPGFLTGPQYDSLTEFEENPYAYWGWTDAEDSASDADATLDALDYEQREYEDHNEYEEYNEYDADYYDGDY